MAHLDQLGFNHRRATRVRELTAQGATVREIAADLGLSYSGLRDWLRRHMPTAQVPGYRGPLPHRAARHEARLPLPPQNQVTAQYRRRLGHIPSTGGPSWTCAACERTFTRATAAKLARFRRLHRRCCAGDTLRQEVAA